MAAARAKGKVLRRPKGQPGKSKLDGREEDALLTELLLEHLILGPQVLDHLLLLAIDPARENNDVQLPRLKNKIHERAISVKEVGYASPCCFSVRRSTDFRVCQFRLLSR